MTAPVSPTYRTVAASVAIAGTVFWIYTFYAIAQVPPGDGSGFQWLAVIPLGMIYAILFLPAWLLVGINRLPRLSLALGLCGLTAFAVVWMQLLGEFPKS